MSNFYVSELNLALLDQDTQPTTKEQEAQQALYQMLMTGLAPKDTDSPR